MHAATGATVNARGYGSIANPIVLKHVHFRRSLASTLVALPSISLIPFRSIQLSDFVPMPDIPNSIACNSVASNFACFLVSSTSGGRTLVHSGSFR
jgi:hypothetical protein